MENITRFTIVGHVDHGKSTLAGQILVLTNTVSLHNLNDKKLSNLLDINKEEQESGITIESSEIEIIINDKKVIMIDNPGHTNLISECINSACNSDVGLLVVSSKLSEFEKGLTGGTIKDNLEILRVAGVPNIIVVYTKTDISDDEQFNKCRDKLLPLIYKIGWKNNLQQVKVSGLTGNGFNDLFELLTKEYKLHEVNKNIKIETNKIVVVKIQIKENIILTAGYTCLTHICLLGNHIITQCEVVKTKKQIMKKNDVGEIKCKFNSVFEIKGGKCIFRLNNTTVAYGVIE